MTLPELRFNIDEKTGAWIRVAEDLAPHHHVARPPYIRFERRPLAPGETFRVRHSGGHLTDELRAFPAEQTHKVMLILVSPDGTEQEALHYGGPGGEPLDHIPGVPNS